MKMQKIGKRLAVFVAGLLAAGLAQATLIFQDTFSTNGALKGRAVETGTGTWIADATLMTSNGAALPGATANGKDGLLAFTPETGKIYTLSADVNVISGSTYVGIGFASNTNGTPNGSEYFHALIDTLSPWINMQTNRIVGTMTGPAGGGLTQFSGKGTNGTVKVVLDTTGANWVSTWYFNNTALRTNTFSGTLGINYVGFGTGGSVNTTVDNFKLEMIPEPATLGLFGVVGSVLVFVRHRMMQ